MQRRSVGRLSDHSCSSRNPSIPTHALQRLRSSRAGPRSAERRKQVRHPQAAPPWSSPKAEPRFPFRERQPAQPLSTCPLWRQSGIAPSTADDCVAPAGRSLPCLPVARRRTGSPRRRRRAARRQPSTQRRYSGRSGGRRVSAVHLTPMTCLPCSNAISSPAQAADCRRRKPCGGLAEPPPECRAAVPGPEPIEIAFPNPPEPVASMTRSAAGGAGGGGGQPNPSDGRHFAVGCAEKTGGSNGTGSQNRTAARRDCVLARGTGGLDRRGAHGQSLSGYESARRGAGPRDQGRVGGSAAADRGRLSAGQ